jgi:catechol 2,3-dioxygenase-like lactoylglutathione lyase family enzyme
MFKDSPAFSGYSVTSLDQAKDFYVDVLGCTLGDEQMGLGLVFPNGHSVFLYEKADHVPATYTVLNFPVDSIDDAVDQLVEKDIVMERYDNMPAPQDEKGVLRGKAAGMGPDIAWFRDPFGNILAVLES